MHGRDAERVFVLPQFGIFAQGTHAHHFLEFDLKPEVTASQAVEGFRALRTPDVAAGGVNLVIAFGAGVWREVAPTAAPAELAPFEPVAGGGRSAPATQHDAWLWISGAEPDVTWQSARAAARAVAGAAQVAAEQDAFTYHGGRDITGFIDGTANPQVRRAAEVALVAPGLPGEGGSHVLAMRWVHDLAALRPALRGRAGAGVRADEGRQRGAAGERRSRQRRTSRGPRRRVDGHELEIFRRSVPYGSSQEHGLYFVAFSAERSRYDRILARMFGTAGDGVHDRLTDFSRPVSGAYYFAPSSERAQRARRHRPADGRRNEQLAPPSCDLGPRRLR